MKTIGLVFCILFFTYPALSQPKYALISQTQQNKAVPSPKYNRQPQLPVQSYNTTANNPINVNDYLVGGSRYDNQTNGSMTNRLYLWPDSSLSVSWMRGTDDSTAYSNLGTAYNYFDGANWDLAPSTRIETTRTGWPSINPWMGNGEILISHNSTASLVINTRPSKGTGDWIETFAPAAPAGVTALLYPSAITSGVNHQCIHILAIAQPNYQGMNDALLYFRSSNGGVTWDRQGVILSGMSAADGLGYASDDYTWAAPRGDTLAFVVAGNWEDGFIMKSFDNGTTWTKTVFFNNPYKLTPVSLVVPAFWCLDGSNAIEMDKTGKAHVCAGRMRASCDGMSRFYYPYTDGLIYWNESMTPIDTSRLGNMDTLEAHNQLIAFMDPWLPGDTISGLPLYGVGLTSFPRIVIDRWDNLYFLWSSVFMICPDPTPLNYRHIYGCMWKHNYQHRFPFVDFYSDFVYIFQEFVYPVTATSLRGKNQVQLICETSSQPGSNIQDPSIPVHDVDISYRQINTGWFVPVNTGPGLVLKKNQVSRISPNPVASAASCSVFLDRAGQIKLEVIDMVGHKVLCRDEGILSPGAHLITLDCCRLARGCYCFSVYINGEAFSQKLIRQ